MGEITDTLRAGLRELAQSDARLLREMDALIPSGAAVDDSDLAGAAALAQIDDGLERLSLKDLKDLCKQRKIKGIAKLKKDELIALLRGGAPSPPAALPAGRPAASGSIAASAPAGVTAADGPSLAALEARLERMEALLVRMASHLGLA